MDEGTARTELERVLKSTGFARNERLSSLLRFVVERHLEGREHELKESVIGTEVFGRKPDYNPKQDPIVRTEARRLRERLRRYYEDAGVNDPVRIELPKGGYVPLLLEVSAQSDVSAPGPEPVRRRMQSIGSAATIIAVAIGLLGWMLFGSSAGVRPSSASGAHNLYVRARTFQALPAAAGVESSIDLFQEAIAKDPSFAPAYAGLAAGYAIRSGFDGFDVAKRAEMLAEGWASVKKAVELAPQSAEAQEGLAMMQAREAQWSNAERSFRRAIQKAPSEVMWHDQFAMFLLLPLGRVDEAVRQLRMAETLDPLSAQTHDLLRLALRSAGRFDEALFHCQKSATNDRYLSDCWAENLEREGKPEEEVRILEAAWSEHLMEPGAQVLGVAYAKAGRRHDAERIASMLPRLASKAQIYAALGDKDRTLALLNQMAPMGPARIGRDFLISPNFVFLRGDSRLTALRKNVGLPE